MNILYTTKTSPWESQPTTEEIKELEYTQLEENNGNGKGNQNNNIPVNGGIVFILVGVLLFGLFYSRKWKPSHS